MVSEDLEDREDCMEAFEAQLLAFSRALLAMKALRLC